MKVIIACCIKKQADDFANCHVNIPTDMLYGLKVKYALSFSQ
jgi:hypothetical protein